MSWLGYVRACLTTNRARTALSVLGIAIGVTAFVSISAGIHAVGKASLGDSSDSQGARAWIGLQPLGIWGSSVPMPAAEAARRLPGVRTSFVVSNTEARVRVDDRVIDLSLNGLEPTNQAPVVAGRPVTAGTDEMVFPVPVATRLGLEPGERAVVLLDGREIPITVAGLARATSDGDGAFAMTHIDTVQRWMGTGFGATWVGIRLEPGLHRDAWLRTHRGALGPLQPAPPAQSLAFFDRLEQSVAPVSAAAFLVAGYLIFLTLGRAIQERRAVHAMLRAIGATRAQLLRTVLSEAVIVGTAGTLTGVAAGMALTPVVGYVVRDLLGQPVAGDLAFGAPVRTVVIGSAVGLLTSLGAAAWPAVLASRTQPAIGMRDADRPPRPVLAAAVGVPLLVAGAIDAYVGPARSLGPLIALGGCLLVTPILLRTIASGCLRVAERWRPGPGEVALTRVVRRPAHAGRNAALLSAALGMTFFVAVIASSSREGFARVVASYNAGDIAVSSSNGRPIAPDLVAYVRAAPQVRSIALEAEGSTMALTKRPSVEHLRIVEPDQFFELGDFAWTPGSDGAAAQASFRAGGAVLLAQSVAARLDRSNGETLTLQTPAGTRDFTVAGTYADLLDGPTRSVVVSMEDASHFGYRGPTRVVVSLQPGTDPVAAAALARGVLPGVSVELQEGLRDRVVRQFEGLLGLVTVVVGISALVAIIGLATTLIVDIVDRRHEVAMLRALGTSRTDIARTVATEALALSGIACVIGIGAGSGLGWLAQKSGESTGTLQVTARFAFPTGTAAILIVAALAAGLVASIAPARRAAAVDPAIALRS